jgi:hypothetical protein
MIAGIHPPTWRRFSMSLPPAHVVDIFYAIADTEMAADVFSQMAPSLRTQVMTESPIEKLAGRARTPASG